MANIRQIAKEAGVSVTTVSRVLNGHPYVSEDKRQAVIEAMEQLQYTPNRNAVHLAKGRTFMVAVMLPFANHPYFSGLVDGIAYEALQHQYRIILCQTDYSISEEERALQLLRDKLVDGVIICSRQSSWHDIKPYEAYGPVVACEYTEAQEFSSIYMDHYQTMKHALDVLIEHGHRRIGYCLGRPDSYNSIKRLSAYREALQQLGEPFRAEWGFHHCYHVEDGAEVIRTLLQLQERPTALLVAGDQSAAGMMLELRNHSEADAQSFSIIGFDNLPIAKVLGLTTFDLSSYDIGRKAFELFKHQLDHPDDPPERHELPFRMIHRSSVYRVNT
ncbi:LacI family DNA-binding transcriptional regulator [Paenibacillus sp. SC116]|uniref:LacI family DNA-binding transcriptional regulator n=1 Tax=Paenibacillus sp. SC116 TaxID=2968986 RepID=UPI00215A1B1C|nr:LacI family DNA-binding transcriptional regulator [Paenibacillus sp. SC116]